MTPEQKKKIDDMPVVDMARLWRFAADNEPLLQGDCGEYFIEVFFHQKGGFNPAISKAIGW